MAIEVITRLTDKRIIRVIFIKDEDNFFSQRIYP